MGFTQIKIKNFRSITNLTIEGFKRINLFAGKNNCGKTSVLESIFVLSGGTNPGLPLATNGLREYKKFRDDDFLILFNNLKYENKIVLESIEETGSTRKLVITPVVSDVLRQKPHISSINKIIKGLAHSFDFKSLKTKNINTFVGMCESFIQSCRNFCGE